MAINHCTSVTKANMTQLKRCVASSRISIRSLTAKLSSWWVTLARSIPNCVGFLNEDFVSIQKDSFNDNDDREEAQASIGDESELLHYGISAGHAVEAAKEIVKAVTTEEI